MKQELKNQLKSEAVLEMVITRVKRDGYLTCYTALKTISPSGDIY
jgi:hypothetical protein